MKTTEPDDYQSQRRALDAILAALQAPDVDVDEAVELYERGLKLASALRAHLDQTENKLERVKLQALSTQVKPKDGSKHTSEKE